MQWEFVENSLVVVIQHIPHDIRINGISIGDALHFADNGFLILTAQAFLCCGRIPDLPILRVFGHGFPSIVGLTNINAIHRSWMKSSMVTITQSVRLRLHVMKAQGAL